MASADGIELPVGGGEVALHREHRLQLRHRFDVTSAVVVVKSDVGVDRERERIELVGRLDFAEPAIRFRQR